MTFLKSKSFRFARNVGWNLLGQVAIMAIAIVATPYIVHRLGLEAYGLYVLLHASSGYLLLLNFGSGSAASKYVAEYKAQRHEANVRAAVRYAALYHILAVGCGALIFGFGAKTFAVRLFHVAPDLQPLAVFVLRCAAAGAVCVAVVQLVNAVLQGLQEFAWSNLLSLLQAGMMPLGVLGLLAAGHGLRAAALWFAAMNFALALAASLLSARGARVADGKVTLGFPAFSRFAFSWWLGQVAWIVTFQFDKIFIARSLPLSELTLYAIPAGLLQRLQIIPSIIAGVLLPMVSEAHGEHLGESLRRMYLKTLRLVLWLVLPLLALLFAFLPQALGLWLGVEFTGHSIWPVRILIVANMFFLASGIPGSLAGGRGKAYYFSYVAWAQSAISLLVWWLAVPRLHLYGAALGTLLAHMLPAFFYIPAINRHILDLPFSRYVREGLWPPFACAALVLAVGLVIHPYATSWVRLIGLGGGSYLLYLAASWFLFTWEDRQLVRSFLKFE